MPFILTVEPLIADVQSSATHVANGLQKLTEDMDMGITPCLGIPTSQDLVLVTTLEECLAVVNAQQIQDTDIVTMPCLAIPISQDLVLAITQEVFSPVNH